MIASKRLHWMYELYLKWRLGASRFEPKVFVVGFQKTGTTSMGEALKILGFKHNGWNRTRFRKGFNLMKYQSDLIQYDSFDDEPFSVFTKSLLRTFPNAKFIYTTRSPKDWIGSCQRHFSRYEGAHSARSPRDRELDFEFNQKKYGSGDPTAHASLWQHSFRKHQLLIEKLAKEHPKKFFCIDITNSGVNPWIPLCDFLELPLPAIQFPHANKTQS